MHFDFAFLFFAENVSHFSRTHTVNYPQWTQRCQLPVCVFSGTILVACFPPLHSECNINHSLLLVICRLHFSTCSETKLLLKPQREINTIDTEIWGSIPQHIIYSNTSSVYSPSAPVSLSSPFPRVGPSVDAALSHPFLSVPLQISFQLLFVFPSVTFSFSSPVADRYRLPSSCPSSDLSSLQCWATAIFISS